MVTHEARHAAWADRVVFLRDGVVVDETGADRARARCSPARPRGEPAGARPCAIAWRDALRHRGRSVARAGDDQPAGAGRERRRGHHQDRARSEGIEGAERRPGGGRRARIRTEGRGRGAPGSGPRATASGHRAATPTATTCRPPRTTYAACSAVTPRWSPIAERLVARPGSATGSIDFETTGVDLRDPITDGPLRPRDRAPARGAGRGRRQRRDARQGLRAWATSWTVDGDDARRSSASGATPPTRDQPIGARLDRRPPGPESTDGSREWLVDAGPGVVVEGARR